MDNKYIILKNYLYNFILRKRAIEKALCNDKRDMILEVGSGISPVVTTEEHIVYSDLSYLALNTLKKTHGKGMYVVADVMKLPFRSESFSHAISSEVLEHIEDDHKALGEIARVIKPSGAFIVTFPHRRFYYANDDRFVNHLRRYELAEMANYLKEARLRPVLIRKVLGPLEKITMCVAIFCIDLAQKLHTGKRKKIRSLVFLAFFSYLFKWINRFYACLAWIDSCVIPCALSTILLIKAVKE
ncbi:MAG: class I SAM-dependent methyltransferase [Syntrophaceae bacterium]